MDTPPKKEGLLFRFRAEKANMDDPATKAFFKMLESTNLDPNKKDVDIVKRFHSRGLEYFP